MYGRIGEMVPTNAPQISRLAFTLSLAVEIRGGCSWMVSIPGSTRESTTGLGVREHATDLRQGKTSETGRDYGHHLDNHERMCVVRCLSRMHARTVDTTAMEEDAPVCDRFPTGTLGRCSNTQLMSVLLF